MMQSLAETVQEEAEQAAAEGPLTQEALEQHLNLTSFTGSLVLALLQAVETSGAAQESVPKLLLNDRLWTFLVDLADMGGEADRVIRAEILALAGDAEVMDFLRRTAQGLRRVAETLREAEKPETEEAAP